MKRKSPRHTFRFKVGGDGEKERLIEYPAVVRRAKQPVELTLTADDVRRSMSLDGNGNTSTCTMALCAKRQKEVFPHRVEGYIDWQYRTAYVVSKLGKDGLPKECVAYSHNDQIAQLNDSPGGQRKLLKQLTVEGERTITLLPMPKRYDEPHSLGKVKGRSDGSRTGRPHGTGARLRYAMAHVGGVPE